MKNTSSMYIHAKQWSLGESTGGPEQKESLLLWGLLWIELYPLKRYVEIPTQAPMNVIFFEIRSLQMQLTYDEVVLD